MLSFFICVEPCGIEFHYKAVYNLKLHFLAARFEVQKDVYIYITFILFLATKFNFGLRSNFRW